MSLQPCYYFFLPYPSFLSVWNQKPFLLRVVLVRALATAVEWKLTERLRAETPVPWKNLTMLFSGGIAKTLQFRARKAVGYCKQSLTSHSSRSLEDSPAESTEDLRDPTQELSEESKAISSSCLETILVRFWQMPML